MIPRTARPVKGKKSVARRVTRLERAICNWWGRVIRRERRTIVFSLHPTKGWRRVDSTSWTTVR